MISAFARRIASSAVRNQRITEDEIEVYQYGYTVLIEMTICTILSIIIAMAFHKVVELLIYSLFFILLRTFGGGFHADKAWKCLSISLLCIIVVCMCIDSLFIMNHVQAIMAINLVALLIVQPLIENYRYTEKVTSRRIVTLIYLSGCILAGILLQVGASNYCMCMLLAQLIWSGALGIQSCVWNNMLKLKSMKFTIY